MRNSTMKLFAALAAMALPGSAQDWYNSLWHHRKAIQIDRSMVACDSGTNQANFPALIMLADSDLQTHARWDGSDLVFTASNGTTKLDREIESYTWSTGTLLAWVRIPELNCSAAQSDTVIYLYYGSPAGTDLDAATVWDSHYLAVLHFASAQAIGKDSTANHNHGTVHSVTATAGQIGSGGYFDGSTSMIVGTGAQIQGGPFTLETWINPTASGGTVIDIGNDIGVDHILNLYQRSDTGLWLTYSWDTGAIQQDSTVLTGNWTLVAARMSADKGMVVTKNLAPWGPFSENGFFAGTSTYTIGRAGEDAHNFFPGSMDELRISNIRRSDAWLQTEYQNQTNPGAGGFVKSVGLEEAPTATPVFPRTIMMIPMVTQ